MTEIRPAHVRDDIPLKEFTRAEHYETALELWESARTSGVQGRLLGAQLHLMASTHPNTPDSRPAEDMVDAHVEETEESGEYRSGWHDCMTMRKLHDMFPGFAITRPREQDPFELNRRVLGQHGIYTAQAMYAAALAPYHQRHYIPDERSPEGRPGQGLT